MPDDVVGALALGAFVPLVFIAIAAQAMLVVTETIRSCRGEARIAGVLLGVLCAIIFLIAAAVLVVAEWF